MEHTAHRALELARYATRRFDRAGLWAMLNPSSIIVVFERPAEWICRKYHLATEGVLAHIVTLPHVTEQVIDELCDDLTSTSVDLSDHRSIESIQLPNPHRESRTAPAAAMN
ncbi:hypothetical protein [Nocardia sp.]|uniref:hypothetical protein n=1 Tax=Nocardia sp. TaxID=1821 RepID=UPI00261F95F5|nr:hypothetical protein [Nocardia sp.]